MNTDYLIAAWIRYGLLLGACGIARRWVLPEAWADPIAAGVLLYGLVAIHTEPAARYARGLRDPWYGRMMLSAACAHAVGAAAVAALIPYVDLRYQGAAWSGMRFEKPWVNEPSLLEAGSWIALYALLAAAWAVGVGRVSRGAWGAVAPDGHRPRTRKRSVGARR